MTTPATPGAIMFTESQVTQLIALVAKPAAPPKPLHEMTSDELAYAVGEAYAPYLSRTGARRIHGA